MAQPLISLEEVNFRYRAQTEPTLQNISLDIFKGEKIAIVGASGSGKSTLIRLLNGLVPHYFAGEITGKIDVAGIDPRRHRIAEISRHVGTVLQDSSNQFVGLTVADDIAFSLENQCILQELMDERIAAAAGIVGMSNFLTHSPQELSGGQKQRVAMAGVLVDNVEILLFDEPLAMLDPATGRAAIKLIDELNQEQGKTIVIVEHRLEEVLQRHVDRIVLMAHGTIVAVMQPDELLATHLLEEHGIRPPLHVTALKYAGLSVTKQMHCSAADTLQLTSKECAAVRNWVQHTRFALPKSQKSDNVLQLSHVSASYPSDDEKIPVLRDISTAIERGSMVGILGSNGAGKSTLAKTMCGFVPIDSGTIAINNENTANWTIAEYGNRIGYVVQEPNQMLSRPLITEEVELGLRAHGILGEELIRRRDQALKTCGLWKFRTWPISALSHGQKKRVTIAALLALSPEILILDEPTAGSDFAHYTEFMDFLVRLNSTGTTVILITHDMHLALEYTSRVIVVSDGEIIADDHPSVVLTDANITQRADLVTTGLYQLAAQCGIANEAHLVRAFVAADQRFRANHDL